MRGKTVDLILEIIRRIEISVSNLVNIVSDLKKEQAVDREKIKQMEDTIDEVAAAVKDVDKVTYSLKRQVKWLWTLVTMLASALITAGIFLIKGG